MMAQFLSCIPQYSDRDFSPESSFFAPIGIKQGIDSQMLWQKHGTIVYVLCLNFNRNSILFQIGINLMRKIYC